MNTEIDVRYGQELAPAALQLSVVLPTYKERGNVAEIVARLDRALIGIGWEAIFVDDDSPDGTADAAKAIAQTDPRIRCLRRVGRRGLAGACIEGMLSSSAPCVAVMDADLQHDETVLPKMLARLERDKADLVVGSRYVAGGSASSFGETRGFISRLATALTRRTLGPPVSDPMSGFFAMRRDRFDPIADQTGARGIQNPARYRDRGKPSARRRRGLHVRHTPARRKQIQRAGGSRISRPAARQGKRRHCSIHASFSSRWSAASGLLGASDRAEACTAAQHFPSLWHNPSPPLLP